VILKSPRSLPHRYDRVEQRVKATTLCARPDGGSVDRLSLNQRIVLGGGVLVLLASFMPWFGEPGFALDAWDSDFFAWGGTIFVVAGALILGLGAFEIADLRVAKVAAEHMALLATGVGTLLIVIQLLIGESAFGLTISRRFGIFISLAGAAAATYGSLGAVKDAGLDLPFSDDSDSGDDG
jgi:hypothetical protein